MRPISEFFALLLILTTLSLIFTYHCCQFFAATVNDDNKGETLAYISQKSIKEILSRRHDNSHDHHNQRRLSEASDTTNLQNRLWQLESKLSNMSDLQFVPEDETPDLNKYQINKILRNQLDHNKILNGRHYLKGPSNNGTDVIAGTNGIAGTDVKNQCSEDPHDLPYLRSISIEPRLTLSPSFTSINTVYEALVDYNIYVIRVQVIPLSCSCKVKLEDSEVVSGSFNYTLGIGVNVIKLAVIDVSQTEPQKVNSYTLHIIRRKQQQHATSQHSSEYPPRTCILKQDCMMVYSELETCGLQLNKEYYTWSLYLNHLENLPTCSTGNVPGLWYVPCRNCDDSGSCYWNQAQWQPEFCKHRKISDIDIKNCFTRKRLMFIGDSTNRGILHYILERVNGTLMNWDKTHNFRRYLNINNNKTVLSFAYYPQFWLPTNHRPSFDKAIYQLIKWTFPLENNTNTVLIVGGVQWLAKQHLNLIKRALQREELTGIQLIMKGIGAGFHEHVDGVMYVPMVDQRSYVSHEAELGRYGQHNGFDFVPTFNMTMARYRDFYPGQCACHFHKVSAKNTIDKDQYWVEGHVNSVYSELIINQICKPKPPD